MRMAADPTYSKATLTEQALDRLCAELEELHNGGRRWPTDNSRLPPGRILQG
ncbi:hypothetical protein AB0H36_27575 [Kribbella sp. NPDC050820]|uniref:hypothetical protein n=1 Tax=Kribbella sp. NPDC050820 TaxID=3155408 RepID=UPI0033C9CD3A